MKFSQTELQGVTIVDIEERIDPRGFFARSYCEREFKDAGLPTNFCQCNISFNLTKGTLRGMHYQDDPHPEGKLVRCTAGSLFDVIIDLRPKSKTFKQWIGIELTAQTRRAVFIPAGFAHGFQTLEDNTEVFYQMTEFYHPSLGRGVRWNDPAFGIRWPISQPILSDKDTTYEDFK